MAMNSFLFFQVGYITIDNVRYFIEPVDEHQANEQGHHLHIVYEANPDSTSARRSCGTSDNWEEIWKDRFREQLLKGKDKNLKPRGTTSEHRFLEVMVVADKKFMNYHKNRDLETYILTLMNMVSGKN